MTEKRSCDYCTLKKKGDSAYSFCETNLLDSSIGVPCNGDMIVYLRSLKPVGDNGVIYSLCLESFDGDIEDAIDINFCPVCGRDLRK